MDYWVNKRHPPRADAMIPYDDFESLTISLPKEMDIYLANNYYWNKAMYLQKHPSRDRPSTSTHPHCSSASPNGIPTNLPFKGDSSFLLT
jgi:hypothetical protein